MSDTAFVGNTNLLELIGLGLAIDDTFVNDAAVTVTVKTAAGVNVVGPAWPIPMVYVAASDGVYRSILQDSLPFVAGDEYVAYINVDAGVDRIGHWEFEFTPVTRVDV